MDNSPVWFLDVDGVINMFPTGLTLPDGASRGEASPFILDPDYQDIEYPMFPITWRPEIISRMRAMHEEGIVTIKWLTTWGRGANYSLAELVDLPKLEVVADPEDHPYRGMGWHNWWKAFAVRVYIDEHSPSKIVWTDDDLGRQGYQVQDIAEMPNTVLISPKEYRGLEHAQLDLIEEFLRAPVVQTTEDSVK